MFDVVIKKKYSFFLEERISVTRVPLLDQRSRTLFVNVRRTDVNMTSSLITCSSFFFSLPLSSSRTKQMIMMGMHD